MIICLYNQFRAFDSNTLCVVTGKLVWKIVINITPLNNSGNLFDCCYLAALSSWMSYRIPFLRKNELNQVNIGDLLTTKYINLPVLHLPICVTTAYIKGKLLIDPSVS